MALFQVPKRASTEQDLAIVKKAKTKAGNTPTSTRGGGGIANKIALIKAMVEKKLGKYTEETLCIRDAETLHNYITGCIESGKYALDTETDGLDTERNKVVGFSLYYKGAKPCYVPVNHINYITDERITPQVTVAEASVELARLANSDAKCILCNGSNSFDIRHIMTTFGVKFTCWWDVYLGARILNENEMTNRLKPLHQKYVLKGKEDEFTFDELFSGVTFDKVPVAEGSIYASHDAIDTYELQEFQEEYLELHPEKYGLEKVAWVFRNIEMPLLNVVTVMEKTGVEIDMSYAQQLHEEYSQKLEDAENSVMEIIAQYQDKIDAYNAKQLDLIAKNPQHTKAYPTLPNPINISSTKQLPILLYDVLGLDAGIDKATKKPIRGTGEEILVTLDHPIIQPILNYRAVYKLLGTYIDAIPKLANDDNRVRCNFNQYGADTGRFSSSDPKIFQVNWGHKIRLIQGRAIASIA